MLSALQTKVPCVCEFHHVFEVIEPDVLMTMDRILDFGNCL